MSDEESDGKAGAASDTGSGPNLRSDDSGNKEVHRTGATSKYREAADAMDPLPELVEALSEETISPVIDQAASTETEDSGGDGSDIEHEVDLIPEPKKVIGRPFQKGEDPRRYIAQANYTPPVATPTKRSSFKQLQDISKEDLGKKIIEFGTKKKSELTAINKDNDATALDQFVATLWFSVGSLKGSPTDKKLIMVTHGLATEAKSVDLSSSDGTMSPPAQNSTTIALAGAGFLDLKDLSDETLLKIREDAEKKALKENKENDGPKQDT